VDRQSVVSAAADQAAPASEDDEAPAAIIVCDECGDSFKNKGGLASHTAARHGPDAKPPATKTKARRSPAPKTPSRAERIAGTGAMLGTGLYAMRVLDDFELGLLTSYTIPGLADPLAKMAETSPALAAAIDSVTGAFGESPVVAIVLVMAVTSAAVASHRGVVREQVGTQAIHIGRVLSGRAIPDLPSGGATPKPPSDAQTNGNGAAPPDFMAEAMAQWNAMSADDQAELLNRFAGVPAPMTAGGAVGVPVPGN
jgi:hypothetical protein